MILVRVLIGVAAIVLTGASLVMSLWYAATLPAREVMLGVAAACGVLTVALPTLFHGRGWLETRTERGVWIVGLALHSCFVGGFAATIRADSKPR